MADRLSRSVLEFVTKGEDAVVGAYDKVERKAKQSGDTVTAAGQRMGGSMQALTVAMKAFLALEITQRVIQFAGTVMAAADEIDTLAGRIDDTTTNIQRLKAVSQEYDVSLESLIGGVQELQARLGDPSKEFIAALERMNFTVAQLKAQSPTDAYLAVADALGRIPDPADRAATSNDALGRSAKATAGAFREGVDATEAWVEMKPETIAFLDAVKTGFDQAGSSVTALAANAAASVSGWSAWQDAVEYGRVTLNALLMDAKNFKRYMDREFQRTTLPTPMPSGMLLPGMTLGSIDLTKDWKAFDGMERALTKSAQASMEVNKELKAAEEKSDRVRDAWKESVKYFNTADNLGTEFRNTMADTADEIREAVEQVQLLAYQTLPDAAAAAAALRREMEARGAVFPGTVPMYPPGTGDGQQGFWSKLFGAGGDNKWLQMLGSGLGLASGLIPGQSRLGSSIGSVVGGFFGPLGSALGGLAGGLIGKLFGGGQAGETRKARDAWIESVGGIDKLRDMATKAGVSLDKLFSTKKVKDFEAESKRVMAAIEAHQQKVAALQQEMADLEAERDRLTTETTVTHDMMRAQAEKFGINQEGLGQGFQQGRLNASAAEIIEALEIFKRGDANMGTVLFGMRDEISALVRESAKFGTEIPANLQPFIEHLFETGNLLDENGEALKELPTIKFGDAMASQLEKASNRLAEVVDKIADILSQLGKLDGKQIDFTVTGDYRERGGGGPGTDKDVWRDGAAAANAAMSVPFTRPSLAGAAFAMGSSSTPLQMTLDGQVVASAVIRRTGRHLALVGA